MADVLTNAGEEWIVDQLVTEAMWVGWGTGADTADKTDTALSTEGSESRVAATETKTGSGSTAKWQVVATITADGTKTITNAGVLTASTSGTLVLFSNFTGIGVDSGDSIEFTFTLDPS